MAPDYFLWVLREEWNDGTLFFSAHAQCRMYNDVSVP